MPTETGAMRDSLDSGTTALIENYKVRCEIITPEGKTHTSIEYPLLVKGVSALAVALEVHKRMKEATKGMFIPM